MENAAKDEATAETLRTQRKARAILRSAQDDDARRIVRERPRRAQSEFYFAPTGIGVFAGVLMGDSMRSGLRVGVCAIRRVAASR